MTGRHVNSPQDYDWEDPEQAAQFNRREQMVNSNRWATTLVALICESCGAPVGGIVDEVGEDDAQFGLWFESQRPVDLLAVPPVIERRRVPIAAAKDPGPIARPECGVLDLNADALQEALTDAMPEMRRVQLRLRPTTP